jgi:signal transduction histidine kinase
MPSILIVDDEEAIQSLFRAFLEAEGYSVTTAGSAAEARNCLTQRRFDVLLADLMLPEESGLSLLRFATDLDDEMSAVMVTGFPDISTAVEALKEGAYDYLAKPVNRQSLLAVVARAYERKSLVAEKRRLEQENAEYQRSLERKVEERTHDLRESEQRSRELFQETRLAYEELKRTQDRLIQSEKLAAVGELAARVAHGIRNPLSAISNSVGVLKRDLDLEGDDRRLLQVVSNESQRLADMVTDFLRFARPRPLNKSPQALGGVLDDLILLLTKDQRVKDRVTIVKNYEEDLPLVETDEAQIRDAIWNLLVNAVEAMTEGGVLNVSLRSTGEPDPSSVEIAIADTGAGIAIEDKDKAFQPFHTTKADGTGLGLAIVQRIVDGHGGSVVLDSIPAQGSTFTLRLPLKSND